MEEPETAVNSDENEGAGPRAGVPKIACRLILSPVVVAMITLIVTVVVASVPIVAAMFSADIVAVNPVVPEAGHMAGNPNHFVLTSPIARPMVIEGPVTDFDVDAVSANRGWSQNAHGHNGYEQKFVFGHGATHHAQVTAANTVFVVRHAFPL